MTDSCELSGINDEIPKETTSVHQEVLDRFTNRYLPTSSWLQSYTGLIISSDGQFYQYIAPTGKDSERNIDTINISEISEFDTENPINSFLTLSNIDVLNRDLKLIGDLSREEISKQTDGEKVNPITPENALMLLGQLNSDTLINPISESGDPDSPGYFKEVLHKIMTRGIYFMSDHIQNIRQMRDIGYIDFDKAQINEELFRSLLHNFKSKINSYLMAERFFFKGKPIKAHTRLVRMFQDLSRDVSILSNILSDRDIEDYHKSIDDIITNIYETVGSDDTTDNDLVIIDHYTGKSDLNLDPQSSMHLYNIIFNLTHNAWKYSKVIDQKHLPRDKFSPVKIIFDMDEYNMQITVRDSGPFIHEDNVEKILSNDIPDREHPKIEGSGIGLSLAINSLRKNLNGEIYYQVITKDHSDFYTHTKQFVIEIPLSTFGSST